jgi:hypothetical protein
MELLACRKKNNNVRFVCSVSGIDRSKADINNPFDAFIGDPIYDEYVFSFLLEMSYRQSISILCLVSMIDYSFRSFVARLTLPIRWRK